MKDSLISYLHSMILYSSYTFSPYHGLFTTVKLKGRSVKVLEFLDLWPARHASCLTLMCWLRRITLKALCNLLEET